MKLVRSLFLFLTASLVLPGLAQLPRLIEHGALPPYAPYIANFAGFKDMAFAHGDINSDGFSDVIIAGSSPTLTRDCHIYLQDAHGNYWKTATNPITPSNNGSLHLQDLNGDSTLDLLLCGNAAGNTYISELYLNDGKGKFTKKANTPFLGVYLSNIVAGDVDGDQIPDVILSGVSKQNGAVIRWYKNDGSANFTYDSSTSLAGPGSGRIRMADLDGDGDNDLLACGYGTIYPIHLFLNNGFGTFQEITPSDFPRIGGDDMEISDLDFDGDMDFIISGPVTHFNPYYIVHNTLIYLNDGSANFARYNDTVVYPFGDHIVLEEFTGDTIKDLIIIGFDSLRNGSYYLFEGRTDVGFNHYDTLDVPWLIQARLGAYQMDADSLMDLFFVGYGESKYYLNRGTNAGNGFELVRNTPLNVMKGSVSENYDFNGDQYPDLIISGTAESQTFFYISDGTGSVLLDTSYKLPAGCRGILHLVNMDSDTTKEVVVSSSGVSIHNVSVYDQGPDNTFSLLDTVDDLHNAVHTVGDVNGDGTWDVVIQGTDDNSDPKFRLYRNDGFGHLILDPTVILDSLIYASASFGDIDNDQDQDLILCGNNGLPVTRIYLNDGTGNFQLKSNHGVAAFQYARMQFIDLDQDGDQDLFVSGTVRLGVAQYAYQSKIYLNDGAGQFTEKTGPTIRGYYSPHFRFIDLNYDGHLDLYICGYGLYNSNQVYTEFYKNDGNLNFTLFSFPNFPLVAPHLTVTDLQKDGEQEWIIGGAGLNRLYTLINCGISYTLDSVHSCGSYTWINNTTYTQSDYNDSLILLNTEGCDSVIRLRLTIVQPDTGYLSESGCDSFLWLDGHTYYGDTILSYATTGMDGCDSVVRLTLSILRSAKMSLNEVICDSFQWLDGHNYFMDTTLYFMAMTSAGCDSMISITLNRQDVGTTVTQSSTGLTALDSLSSYLWLYCDSSFLPVPNATSRTFLPSVNGNYAVRIDDGICMDTSACITFLGTGTATVWKDKMTISPNPVRDILTVGLPMTEGRIELFNMNGKAVYAADFEADMSFLRLDMRGLAAGTYLVRIQMKTSGFHQIVIKE